MLKPVANVPEHHPLYIACGCNRSLSKRGRSSGSSLPLRQAWRRRAVRNLRRAAPSRVVRNVQPLGPDHPSPRHSRATPKTRANPISPSHEPNLVSTRRSRPHPTDRLVHRDRLWVGGRGSRHVLVLDGVFVFRSTRRWRSGVSPLMGLARKLRPLPGARPSLPVARMGSSARLEPSAVRLPRSAVTRRRSSYQTSY
jgi:hypothetical protein